VPQTNRADGTTVGSQHGGRLAGPPATSLLDHFRATLARRPEAAALIDGHGTMSYSSLDVCSASLASHLASVGAGPCQRVALSVARGAPALIGTLAILKTGAAYVPLDPSYPRERLEFMLEDCGATIVLTDSGDAWPSRVRVLNVDECLAQPRSTSSLTEPGPESPAYVIYTSGSTGQPKGVIVTHANVLALIQSGLELFDVSDQDRWSLFSSYGFDVSVWEMWMALASGATCVAVPATAARDTTALVDLLASARVTVLNVVPSVFRHLARAYARCGAPSLDLRYAIFAGESLDRSAIRAFQAAAPGESHLRLINMYGITETTVHATFKELADADLAGSGPTPIGTALPHLEIQLLDEQQRPVRAGDVGEMWVLGDGVAAGYLNRPELTRERFQPMVSDGELRPAYRSGDLARHRADGELEYVGRADAQLKLLGFRLEPGEIEHALREHPAITEAAVVKVDRSPDPLLVAVVRFDARELPAAEIRSFLARRLPSHMIPNRIIAAHGLALSPTGKLDRGPAQQLAEEVVAG
jgi:amino acid adenylation domain-containing protein